MDDTSGDIRLGVIGVDSSHLPEFTRRIHEMRDAGKTRCRVVSMWTDSQHDLPQADVERWQQTARDLGVEDAADLDTMLANVDGAMVLSVNGNKHLAHATPALRRGLPTYVDKPLTCNLDEAKQLLKLARDGNARCYSASSLRFVTELEELAKRRESLGDLVAVDAVGPGELNESMAGLFFYGVHSIELVDAIWGPGVKRISAIRTEPRDLVRLDYGDNRLASIRLERQGSYTFAATIHGTKGMYAFEVDFAPVYTRLVAGMTRFFEGGQAPVDLRDIVENVAVMQAGNASMERDGAWQGVETIS